MVKTRTDSRRSFLKGSAALAAAGVPTLAHAGEPGFVVDPAPRTTLGVVDSDSKFPVRRVYCLGRNYVAHAEEMGDDPDTAPPFFFMKPTDAVCAARDGFVYPSMSSRVGYEIELVIALRSGGRDIRREDSLTHIYGYGVGLDMTRRDLQDEAKQRRRPWEAGKSFDGSAPTGPIKPVSMTGHPDERRIWLSVNGEVRQDSNTAKLRWGIAETIATLSRYFALAPGDLIYSGTPAGVGLVEKGDVMRGGVDGVDEIEVDVL